MASAQYVNENLGQQRPYLPMGSSDSYTPPPPSCHLVHLEYLARHGSDQPENGTITRMADMQASIQDFLAEGGEFNPEYSWMGSWTPYPYIPAQGGLLNEQGAKEHYDIAKRMVLDYPEVMNKSYNPKRFHFQETQITRTGVSAMSFAFGMMEGKDLSPPFIESNTIAIDKELFFFAPCLTYNFEVLLNKSAYIQESLFEKTLAVNAVEVSKRLGTFPLWNLTSDDIQTMWSTCKLEASLQHNYSQFCSIWSTTDVDSFSFVEDLDFYYKRGYGYEIDYSCAVDLMGGIFGNIADSVATIQQFNEDCGPIKESWGSECQEKARNAPYNLAGSFRFAHAETMTPILAWLGLYNTPSSLMRADTPPQKRNEREWKTSILTPYAANLNFAVYLCDEEGEGGGETVVKVLHNEKEMVLPCCEDVYCPFETMVD
eukprot:CAMPEP_0201510548 /NCGR_PEP_ID=MMETSP0161_2-20130828/3190_1 /ASSEMBLY_ACC=CAM_ASM_000251 /TAXON_ID=180227 /ORGANISM="Neoparamoeba aestuarina, Strain SoJaBio B1-5/56/2" /LENGTH=428 /DNA_ID=CAMNT_0047905737 /DNA_START=169 /DNA_END=1452 /DNA_ORIENTATION=-